jgi:hypothetical protein
VQDVFGFGMGKAKGASVKDQLRGAPVIELRGPQLAILSFPVHVAQ